MDASEAIELTIKSEVFINKQLEVKSILDKIYDLVKSTAEFGGNKITVVFRKLYKNKDDYGNSEAGLSEKELREIISYALKKDGYEILNGVGDEVYIQWKIDFSDYLLL